MKSFKELKEELSEAKSFDNSKLKKKLNSFFQKIPQVENMIEVNFEEEDSGVIANATVKLKISSSDGDKADKQLVSARKEVGSAINKQFELLDEKKPSSKDSVDTMTFSFFVSNDYINESTNINEKDEGIMELDPMSGEDRGALLSLVDEYSRVQIENEGPPGGVVVSGSSISLASITQEADKRNIEFEVIRAEY